MFEKIIGYVIAYSIALCAASAIIYVTAWFVTQTLGLLP